MDCLIRPWEREDAADLAKALNNQNVQKNLRDGIPYPYTVDDAKEFIRAMLQTDPNQAFSFAIVAEGIVIGSIGAFRKENIHCRTAEIGYYIGEPFWGRGYGTSAVKQVCGRVFETTDIIRIFAEPFAHNAASCRILEKAGFVFEGLMRQNAIKNGIVTDMKLYALLKEDIR
ncbi:MAG: GNAT family N-acetyltransferase [Oscillospiraceae bacterium]|nr:GNAT family N-acetyltransferase [Oscillospiraceae bacterium]